MKTKRTQKATTAANDDPFRMVTPPVPILDWYATNYPDQELSKGQKQSLTDACLDGFLTHCHYDEELERLLAVWNRFCWEVRERPSIAVLHDIDYPLDERKLHGQAGVRIKWPDCKHAWHTSKWCAAEMLWEIHNHIDEDGLFFVAGHEWRLAEVFEATNSIDCFDAPGLDDMHDLAGSLALVIERHARNLHPDGSPFLSSV